MEAAMARGSLGIGFSVKKSTTLCHNVIPKPIFSCDLVDY